MPNRPDLRQITGNIREALADCDRETLVDMLTFVFKAYVVEGPPPMLVNQTERIADLEGLSLAQLIRTLQTRLDLPELSLFQVDGEQVSVRVHGTMTQLDTSSAGRARGGAAAAPAAPPPQPEDRGPGVRVVETRFERRPPATTRAATQETTQATGQAPASPAPMETRAPGQPGAPPPRRGLSVRGASVGGSREAAAPPGAGAAPSGAPSGAGAGAPSGQAPAASPPPARRDEPAGKSPRAGEEDLASTRFSLLELD